MWKFINLNLSSTDTVKIGHAFTQSVKMQKRGHPITVFLNGGAILVAVKDVPQTSFMDKSLQKLMLELMHGGAKINISHGILSEIKELLPTMEFS